MCRKHISMADKLLQLSVAGFLVCSPGANLLLAVGSRILAHVAIDSGSSSIPVSVISALRRKGSNISLEH